MTSGREPPEPRPRLRDRGLAIGTLPTGRANAITDVAAVRVGHVTLHEDDPVCVRTGVTIVLPRDADLVREPVPAAVHVMNAFGKPTGTTQLEELGVLETPLVLTNTLSVGVAYDALVEHALASDPRHRSVNPVVFECNDGWLNEIAARRVRREHVLDAISEASGGRVAEGSVGAGAGMVSFGWKAGIGTSSRRCGEHVVGALVLANFGRRPDLRIGGVAVGGLLAPAPQQEPEHVAGSCVVVLATDAPLDARQLRRLAARAPFALGRTGAYGQHGSGDYAIAFAAGGEAGGRADGSWLDPLFAGAVDAVEEAILDALFVADTVVGRDGRVAYGLPVPDVLRVRAGDERA